MPCCDRPFPGPPSHGADVLTEATAVVLLASFGRFVPEGPQGRALRTGLKGMRKAIGGAGETAMLRTFLQRAAQPGSADGLPAGPVQKGLSAGGRKRLAEDLDQLIATSGLPEGLPSRARVLVVDAEEDAIVAPAASREQLIALEAISSSHQSTGSCARDWPRPAGARSAEACSTVVGPCVPRTGMTADPWGDRVLSRFGAAAGNYDAAAMLQRAVAWRLAGHCKRIGVPRGLWVDLGSGTGNLADALEPITQGKRCCDWTAVMPCCAANHPMRAPSSGT